MSNLLNNINQLIIESKLSDSVYSGIKRGGAIGVGLGVWGGAHVNAMDNLAQSIGVSVLNTGAVGALAGAAIGAAHHALTSKKIPPELVSSKRGK
ncbi:MAG: hypothetical protein H7836_12460 [Magnetococcus sp. YQC-3]